MYDKSTDYCTNGNYGVKATNDGINVRPNLRYWMSDVSELIGKTLKFSADVKNKESLNIVIYQHDGSSYTNEATSIPANSNGNFSITVPILENTTALWFGFDYVNSITEDTSFYTDNWCLEEI